MRLPRTILLAEDNPGDAALVREALREHGIAHELNVVTDGELAIRFINELEFDETLPCPDVLLLDLHLPKYTGQDVLQRLRESRRCASIPVIVLAAAGVAAADLSVHYFAKPNTLREYMELGSLIKQVIHLAA